MSILLGVASVVAAASLLVGAVAALRYSREAAQGPNVAPQRDERVDVLTDRLTDLRADVAELANVVAGLPSLWEAERERAEEANERAKGRLAAARAAESRANAAKRDAEGEDGDDASEEAAEFLRQHAQGGNGEGMHPMSGDVEGPPPDDLTERALASGWTPYL